MEDADIEESVVKGLKSSILYEATPRGGVIMFYDFEKESFCYYSDTKDVPYLFLETAARRYVTINKCKQVYVDMKEQLLVANNMNDKKLLFIAIGIIILPPIAFVITKRICLSLQRADRELVLHGRETGRLLMLPHGEFVEVHEPISPELAWKLTAHEQAPALALEDVDARGVRRTGGLKNKLRKRMSQANAESIAKPTANDLKEIEHH